MDSEKNTSGRSTDPVLIVGAGPTGLMLAIELARRGVPFHLIDQRPAPLPWDRAAVVNSRSLEIFATLGVAPAMIARGTPIRGTDFYDRGAKRASFRLAGVDTPFPFTLGLSESVTEELLTGVLAGLGGAVDRGVTFVGLEADKAEVRARVVVDGVERVLRASYLVGADGLHSHVRDAVGIDFPGHDYPVEWGVVDARYRGWPYPQDITSAMFDPPLISIPIGGGRFRIYFRGNPNDPVPASRIGEWLGMLAPGASLLDCDEPQLFHSHCRVATTFRAGRVLLAGDAAHACSPFEGHGMNAGIQDAFNLGWKLALVVGGLASDDLLASYDAERRPVAALIGGSGDDAEANLAKGNPEAIDTITTALAVAENQMAVALAESEIMHGYDDSPILDLDNAPASPATRIGHRMGDAGPLRGQSGEIRLHQLFGHTGHTLLVFAGDDDAGALETALGLARRLTLRHAPHLKAHVIAGKGAHRDTLAEDVLIDEDGAAHARLSGEDQPSLCLVRPDGHLGLRATPASAAAVDAYLARILA